MTTPAEPLAVSLVPLRRLLWWCRLNAALFLVLLLGWVTSHVIQVPPLDEVQIALEVEPGHPGAEDHITHVLAGCEPYSEVYDSRTTCVVAYLDHGSPRIRHLHFRHSGRFTPETWDTWGIVDEESTT